ncbi:MAG: class I SAM-dependent methyltransferase, partial [Gammaproteobacteria bacterium]
MSGDDRRNRPNPATAAAIARHVEAIRRTLVDHSYAYDSAGLLNEKLEFMAANCNLVLDIGQSTRERFGLFQRDRIETMNVNLETHPADIIDDICAPSSLRPGSYDGIVCLSVLEHVYDPFAAIENIHALLKPGGYLLLHLPFLFRYHAPLDLSFTDGYRFSRDGVAWLLRDFAEVRLYSIRGPYSSIFNLHRFWKKGVEKHLGMKPAR